MLEIIDFEAPKMTKDEYKPQYKALIDKLVVLQQQAKQKQIGLVVLVEGWDGAGKGSRISDLMYNLDARATSVHVTSDVSESETLEFLNKNQSVTGYFPLMQQFWDALGERGSITFYDRGWYTTTSEFLMFRQLGSQKKGGLKKLIKRLSDVELASGIESFERQLVEDGYLVVKLFVHVSKDAQKKRLQRLYDDPTTSWRVSERKLKHASRYNKLLPLFDKLLTLSDYDFCPWTIVNGEDKRAANILIARALVDALEKGLAHHETKENQEIGEIERRISPEVQPATSERINKYLEEAQQAADLACRVSQFQLLEHPPTLDEVDHKLSLSEADYREQLKFEQKRLKELEPLMYQARIPLMIMYEGWDAAGKGGNIKRVAQALDARAYTIFPSAAPTYPEMLHPHLWRYWVRLPKAGHIGIYDRSWYGRVLVERVEGFASATEWARAYNEINEFEQEMNRWGAILIKFWVEVSQSEQLLRFRDRENNPDKSWKITPEDWRNREKYPEYREAVQDMFRLTSTSFAPWIILESDDKMYARVKALKVINDTVSRRLHES